MKCKDFEQDIYLYSELSEAERVKVDAHIQECTACKELFQLVASANAIVAKASLVTPEVANHGRLTSNIMQALQIQQKNSSALSFKSLFVKYAMVAASLILVTLFVVEQQSGTIPKKTTSLTETVTLNSASLTKAFLDRKEKGEPAKTSLYACAKSGDCNNNLIESFKKKSL